VVGGKEGSEGLEKKYSGGHERSRSAKRNTDRYGVVAIFSSYRR
jgi:hypothetical protein